MQSLGLDIPNEFKISAAYALSHKFNDLVVGCDGFLDDDLIQQVKDLNYEAKRINIQLDKAQSSKIFSTKILQNINRLEHSFEIQQASAILELFDNIEALELQVDISEAQNIYYNKIYHRIGDVLETASKSTSKTASIKNFADALLKIGEKLNINTEFYQKKADKILLTK